MEYITVVEAARRLQVSDKTIRRAIHAGKLPARYPKKNRCEIAVDDLEMWRSSSLAPSAGDTQREIAALSQRVSELERSMTELQHRLTRLEAVQPKQPLVSAPVSEQPTARHAREQPMKGFTDPPLAEGRVMLQKFADLHGMSRNETERLRKTGFIRAYREPLSEPFGRPGSSRRVRITIDAQGKRDFWVQFHETPGFRSCDDCPHATRTERGASS